MGHRGLVLLALIRACAISCIVRPVIRYIGVRHHSPACARLARHVIRETKPAYVLIEGPADMNARISELLLEHALPIAIFTYHQDQARSHSSWSPFCDYSPEWVAIAEGHAVGADVRFIDLPAWHEAFAQVRNRYSDGDRRTSQAIRELCDRLGVDGMDALWDHLFEQPMPETVLEERLRVYFDGLRGDEPGGDCDGPREDFMARCIAWAAKDAERAGRDVVVLTGGYHKPALEKLVPSMDGAEWPTLEPAPADVRRGSFLVPYSFKRLDSFVGYESGMPSPDFYQTLWEKGPEEAPEQMMRAAVTRLRAKEQRVSAADSIATRTMAEGLARMRGHEVLSRVDLLDGIAAALVKDAQDVPLPWTERGRLRAATDPMLVEVIAALSGERRGSLHADTPRPPLLADVRATLENLELVPHEAPRAVPLSLTKKEDLEKSRTLHRLRVLGIPGFTRISGPTWATEPVLDERWELVEIFERESALIEAGAYGATLEAAAGARLEEAITLAGEDLEKLTAILGEATFVGMEALSSRILGPLATLAARESDATRLGRSLSRVLALYRHDSLLGSARSEPLGVVVEAAFDRGLWLIEGIQGGAGPVDDGLLVACVALRDALRFAGAARGLDGARAHGVMSRRAVDDTAPPPLRGAALGFLWSMGKFSTADEAEEHAVAALGKASRPEELGDWLAGLFALAREEVLAGEARISLIGDPEEDEEARRARARSSLLGMLDTTLVEMQEHEYLVALPALRLAFSYFPPLEKETIAKRVLRLHGKAESAARALLKLPVDARVVAAGHDLEARVDAIEKRFGLAPEVGEGRADAEATS